MRQRCGQREFLAAAAAMGEERGAATAATAAMAVGREVVMVVRVRVAEWVAVTMAVKVEEVMVAARVEVLRAVP